MGHTLPASARWLTRHRDLLPTTGGALDVACGRGRHALWLATEGLTTLAVDRDPDAIASLRDDAVRRCCTNRHWPARCHLFVSNSLSGPTGSWTKSRQWETQRTLFRSARATMRPPTKVNGVWPFNDAWLRTSLSEAWKSASVRSRSRAWQNSTGSRHSRRVVPIRRPAGCGRRCGGNRGGSGSARRSPDRRCATPCASGGWGCRCGGRPTANRPLIVFAKHVVHPEHSEKNGVVTQPFPLEEAPDEASS